MKYLVLAGLVIICIAFVVASWLPFAQSFGPLGLHGGFPITWLGGFTVYPSLCIGYINFTNDTALCLVAALLNAAIFVTIIFFIVRTKQNVFLITGLCYLVSLCINVLNFIFVGMLHVS